MTTPDRSEPLGSEETGFVPESEPDPVIKATAAAFRYLCQWFGTEEQRAQLREIAEAVEATDKNDYCCPVCEEMTCDEGCPLEPVRARWAREAIAAEEKRNA